MKTLKYQLNGKSDKNPDKSLLNPKQIKAKKQKIKEIEEDEADKEIKEELNNN